MRNVKKLVAVTLVVAAAATVGACGSDSITSSEPEEIVSGKLALLPDAPPGYSGLAGEADLTRGSKGS